MSLMIFAAADLYLISVGPSLRHHCSSHNPDQTPQCHHSPIISIIISVILHPTLFVPSHALRSPSAHRLCVPHVSTVLGSRVFRSASPAIWNSLPLSATSCSNIHTFKKQLKTHLFASAFPSNWIVLDAPLILDDLHLFIYLVVLNFVHA